MSETYVFDEEDLLDLDMDSVEAEPEYIDPTNGHYRFRIPDINIVSYDKKPDTSKGETKEDVAGQKEFMVRFTYQMVQILEAADPAPPLGSLCQEPFGMQLKGQGFLKTRFIRLLGEENVIGKTLREMIDLALTMFNTDYLIDAYVSTYTDKRGIQRYKFSRLDPVKVSKLKDFKPEAVTYWYPSQEG